MTISVIGIGQHGEQKKLIIKKSLPKFLVKVTAKVF